MWRACGNLLATNSNLWHGKFGLGVNYKLDREQISTFDGWLKGIVDMDGIFGTEKDNLLRIVAVCCWEMWKSRCEMIFQKRQIYPVGVFWKVNALVQELSGINEPSDFISNRRNERELVHKDRWIFPAEGWYKVNCDGAFSAAGIGIVIRDADGSLVNGLAKKVKTNSCIVTEAMALKEGVRLAERMGLRRVISETDSELMFQAIQNACKVPVRYCCLVVSFLDDLDSEFGVAALEAEKCGASVVLGDRNVAITWARLWKSMPESLQKIYPQKFSFEAFSECLVSLDSSPEGLPAYVHEIVIDERDRYMATKMLSCARGCSLLVAVVGRLHLKGIRKYWNQEFDLDDLSSV
ncbi:hypothetical protein PTKIN_Ptkin15bG0186900 [Pterospermum kingtungense]